MHKVKLVFPLVWGMG